MNQVKWNTYSDHLADMMEGLLIDGAFSDVTLVTEDKHIFKAHKNILSMCSHFFKNLMTFDPKSSAVIYLKGVHFIELKLIMQFVYLGEATINEERMVEFLAVAKSLEIKELSNAETESNVESDDYTLGKPSIEKRCIFRRHVSIMGGRVSDNPHFLIETLFSREGGDKMFQLLLLN